MDRFTVRIQRDAQKELDSLPLKDQHRIQKVILGLASGPFEGKKLEGKFARYYSIRVWPYRIIYLIHKKELLVIIIKVGHRQGVY